MFTHTHDLKDYALNKNTQFLYYFEGSFQFEQHIIPQSKIHLDHKYPFSKIPMYQFTNAIQNWIQDLLPNGVMATSIVVCSIFFAIYELLRME